MPTVAELERLDALIEKLTPLSQTMQGELIRAGAWNDVVATVIELARAVLAGTSEDVVASHTHTEQVALGWLDPKLRTLIEQGPLADPAAAARLAAVEREVKRTGDRFLSADVEVRELRDRTVELSTRDLKREADVTETRRKVDAIDDSRPEITSIRQTLGSIQADLGSALEVGRRLTVDGVPLDATVLVERLTEVESVHERLRTTTGELLDAGAYERKLAELQNTLVSQAQLDDALNRRRPRLNASERDAMLEELQTTLTGSLQTTIDRTADTLRAEMVAQLGDMDTRVNDAVGSALPGVRDAVARSVRDEFNTTLETRIGTAESAAASALAAREAAIRTDVATKDAELGTAIAGFDTAMKSAFADMRVQVLADAEARALAIAKQETQVVTDRLTAELTALVKTNMDSLSTRLTTAFESSLARETSRLETKFKSQIAGVQSGVKRMVRTEFRSFQPQLDLMVDTTVRRHIVR